MHEAGQHQQKLINTFLKTAEYEAGFVVLEKNKVNVIELLRKQVIMASNLANQTGVEVYLDTPTESLPFVMLDEIKMGQAFQNFITNGLKYNHKGGEVNISVNLFREQGGCGKLEVIFRDTGVGIEAEKYDVVFKRFARLNPQDNDIEGTGLGLAFAKEVVELHGGTIDMESMIGIGTVFIVRVPVTIVEMAETTPA